MKDEQKTKKQLVNEIIELRRRIDEPETSESEHKQVEKRTAKLTSINKRLEQEIGVRKQMEKQLRASEKKYRTLLENLPQKIFLKDKNLSYVSCCEKLARDLKIKPEEIKGKDDFEFHPKALAEKYRADDKMVIESGKTTIMEEDYIQDGQTFTVRTVKTPVKDEEGNITGVIGIFEDITEFKIMEATLRKRNNEMRLLNRLIHQITASLSLDIVVESALEEMVEIIHPDLAMIFLREGDRLVIQGVSPDNNRLGSDEMPEHRVSECLCGLAVSEGRSQYSEFIHNDSRCTLEECKKAGFNSFAALPLLSSGKTIGVLGLASVAKRSFAEQADFLETAAGEITISLQNSILYEQVKHQEEQLQTLIDTMPDSVCFKDGQGRWLITNEFNLRLFELEGVDYRGKTDAELAPYSKFYHDAFLTCEESDEKAWRAKETISGEEVIPRPDGSEKTFDVIKVPLYSADGIRKGLVVVGHDITDRKQAEAELSKSKEMLQAVLDGISDPLIMFDRDMSIKVLNKAALKYYSAPEFEKVIGKPCFEGLQGKTTPCEGCKIPSAIQSRQEKTFERKSIVCPERYEYVAVYPLYEKDGGIKGVVINIRDITENKKNQEQLIRADRLSSLGMLSGGIAHEIRNPLAGISLFLDILSDKDNYDRTAKEIEIFDEIRGNVNKIDGIIKRVLDFARPSKKINTEIDINLLIREENKFWLPQLRKSDIALKLFLEKDIPYVLGDAIELRQVWTNLIQNAMEMMEKGGTLNISTTKGISFFHKDRQVVIIKVKDTGTGIEQENLGSIYNPFFTTKAGGTGLGLAISHQIIERLGGIISCESESGKGTTFTIELPAIEEEIK